jgi:hypothetical protein
MTRTVAGLAVSLLALVLISSGISQVKIAAAPAFDLQRQQRHWIEKGSWKIPRGEVVQLNISIPGFKDLGVPSSRLIPQVSIREANVVGEVQIFFVRIYESGVMHVVVSSAPGARFEVTLSALNCSVFPEKKTN